MTKLTFTLAVIPIVVCGCAADPQEPKGEVLRSGLCVQRNGRSYDQPQSTAGYASVGDTRITQEATVVPLQRGVAFGFTWRAIGMPREAIVDFNVRHPKITRPDGKTLDGFSEPLELHSERGVIESTDCYSLSEDHELVPGQWVLTVSYKGNVLARREYTVVSQ